MTQNKCSFGNEERTPISSLAETSPAGIVFKYFDEIVKIPRPSGHEEKIRAYLLDFAKKNALDAETDDVGNVRIRKPGAPGKENEPPVLLQAHMDMVCEKETDHEIDFENDPIKAYCADGFIRAEKTTLGADNGIGIALILSILDPAYATETGPIDGLFTVDEETGCTGAQNMRSDWLSGKYLINLDWEEETVCLGCAGSVKTHAVFTIDGSDEKNTDERHEKQTNEQHEQQTYILEADGLLGGHSGADIHKGRANALKILARILLIPENISLDLIEGGNLSNAVPRHAKAVFGLPGYDPEEQKRLIREMKDRARDICLDYKETDPFIEITVSETDGCEKTQSRAETLPFSIGPEMSRKLLKSLCACPAGVIASIPESGGAARTSINLASVRQRISPAGKTIEIVTLQRSLTETDLEYVSEMAESVFELAGAAVFRDGAHPGWTPKTESPLLKKAAGVYKDLFGKEPVRTATHAGLECGCFCGIRKDLDMISIGPTISGEHTPDEKLSISSVEKMHVYLSELLGRA